MKVKHAMILAAGLGTRMRPLSINTPKPLLEIGKKNLLQRAIDLLDSYGINQIIINVHHLADQIENFISSYNTRAKIIISNEKELLLDTGGGVKNGTKLFEKKPFFVINPDTLWENFNLKENLVLKGVTNEFIFTGLQLIDREGLNLIDKKIFSMNEVWDKLIKAKKLLGIESKQKFYHINTEEMYKKISSLIRKDFR